MTAGEWFMVWVAFDLAVAATLTTIALILRAVYRRVMRLWRWLYP